MPMLPLNHWLLATLLAGALTARAEELTTAPNAGSPLPSRAQGSVMADFGTPSREPDIGYIPTPEPVAAEMLALAKVGKEDLIYDLGCGDGRIVIEAVRHHGARRGIGIDIDPRRVAEARAKAQEAGIEDRVTFLQEDLFESNFKDASVIALYLLNSLNLKLRPKIFAETNPGTRVVSHAFSMGKWEPDGEKQIDVKGTPHTVYSWVVPANLSGTWRVKEQTTGVDAVIKIEQQFQKITATVTAGGVTKPLGKGRVTGDTFAMTVEGEGAGGTTIEVTGRIMGETINATSADVPDGAPKPVWNGTREPGTRAAVDAETK